MPLVVDTYNVLHVVGILPPDLAGIDTNGLARLIARSRYRGEKTVLVCDGPAREHAPPGRAGNIHIRYSGHGRSADDLITSLIRRSSDPRRLVVVTADREIQRAARRRRCRIVDSAAFMRQLRDDAARPPGPEPAPTEEPIPTDVDTWLEEFGIAEDLEPDLPPLPPSLEPPPPPPPPARPKPPARQEPEPRVDRDRDAGGGQLPPDVIEEAERLLGDDDS